MFLKERNSFKSTPATVPCGKFIAATVVQTVGVIVPQMLIRDYLPCWGKEMKGKDSLCQTLNEIVTKWTWTCKPKTKNILGSDVHALASFTV